MSRNIGYRKGCAAKPIELHPKRQVRPPGRQRNAKRQRAAVRWQRFAARVDRQTTAEVFECAAVISGSRGARQSPGGIAKEVTEEFAVLKC
jgi:hypothetical protein